MAVEGKEYIRELPAFKYHVIRGKTTFIQGQSPKIQQGLYVNFKPDSRGIPYFNTLDEAKKYVDWEVATGNIEPEEREDRLQEINQKLIKFIENHPDRKTYKYIKPADDVMRAREDLEALPCPYCDKILDTYDNLKTHVDEHVEEKIQEGVLKRESLRDKRRKVRRQAKKEEKE